MKMNQLVIRAETAADYNHIRTLIVKVFHETYGSGEAEASIVETLREQPIGGPTLSLVAEDDGQLVGHIFFSAVHLENHPDLPTCALGPLGIYRQYQRQGIGTQLIRAGLAECKNLGYRLVIVQGSLQYYPRFGFIPMTETQLQTTFHSDHDMVLALEDGFLDDLSGLVMYPKPWHVFL